MSAIRRKYRRYRKDASVRCKAFALSMEDFARIVLLPCFYCGEGGINGLDRVDNKVGYIVENVVSCCHFCNNAKHVWEANYFITKCKRVAEKFKTNTDESVVSVSPTIRALITQ